MISTVALALFALLVFGCNATDYCNEDLCPNGGNHIGCNNTNRFAKRCVSPEMVDISHFLFTVLNEHNKYRNDVASGATNFPSAARMGVLTWNKELAKLAEYNVRQCLIQPDDCLNTDDFPACGQNVGYTSIKTPDKYYFEATIDRNLRRILSSWYGEKLNTMIHDRVTDIGCSAITFRHRVSYTHYITLLLTCNYSFTSIKNDSVYVSGAAASKCKTGPDATFTSLCSPSERISAQFKQDVLKSKKKKKCRPRKF